MDSQRVQAIIPENETTTRNVPISDVVGIYEIAERVVDMGGPYDNVSAARNALSTIIGRRSELRNELGHVIRTGNKFPYPIRKLKSASLYDWNEVAPWLRNHYGIEDTK